MHPRLREIYLFNIRCCGLADEGKHEELEQILRDWTAKWGAISAASPDWQEIHLEDPWRMRTQPTFRWLSRDKDEISVACGLGYEKELDAVVICAAFNVVRTWWTYLRQRRTIVRHSK
jgi:hypothetical protein